MRDSTEQSSSVVIQQQGRLLEQAEQFEDNHDNDNYSDYVEDASVHAGDNIKLRLHRPVFTRPDASG
jgi:hypothetical protein